MATGENENNKLNRVTDELILEKQQNDRKKDIQKHLGNLTPKRNAFESNTKLQKYQRYNPPIKN